MHRQQKFSEEQLQSDLLRLNEELFGEKYTVERLNGVPVSDADDRVAMFMFNFNHANISSGSYNQSAFAVTLQYTGGLEFGRARAESVDDQNALHSRLIELYR